jgi:hypothetical protein
MEIVIHSAKDWALLTIVVGTLICLAYALGKESAKEDKIVKLNLDRGDIALMNKGYVFGTVWTMKHLQRYANEIGVVFTIEDYAKIIKLVKDDFKEDEGINKSILLTTMRIYVAYHSSRDFKPTDNHVFDPIGPYPHHSDLY